MKEKFVVARGTAFGGMDLFGPFKSEEAAQDWAEMELDVSDEWEVVELIRA